MIDKGIFMTRTGEPAGRNDSNHMNRSMDQMPIAMAYVPWQKWGETYDADVALERGTIFQQLDLPFLGEEVM